MKPVAALVAFATLALAVAPSLANAQQIDPTEPVAKREKFDPKRDAAKDIQDAIKLATKQNKRIMLDVGGEWCSWCHKLDNFFLTDKEAGDLLKKKFVVVKVNWSPENKNEAVLSKYPEIKGYPHLFVLDKTGKLLHSQDTGLLETGDHHDHDKVMAFLRKWGG